jgi:hypothetical protein
MKFRLLASECKASEDKIEKTARVCRVALMRRYLESIKREEASNNFCKLNYCNLDFDDLENKTPL